MDIKKYTPWNWFKKEENQLVPSSVSDSPFQFYAPMNRLHQEIDRIFEDVFKSTNFPSLAKDFSMPSVWGNNGSLLKPNLDIVEKADEYNISVEVPGVEEKDIHIQVEGGILSIKGEKKHEKEEKTDNYHRVERSYGSFLRTLALPDDANSENINAGFKNGILTVRISKNPEAKPKGKTIEIKKG